MVWIYFKWTQELTQIFIWDKVKFEKKNIAKETTGWSRWQRHIRDRRLQGLGVAPCSVSDDFTSEINYPTHYKTQSSKLHLVGRYLHWPLFRPPTDGKAHYGEKNWWASSFVLLPQWYSSSSRFLLCLTP